MNFLIYIFFKFPVGLCLLLIGWPLTLTVVLAPVGVPMVAAGLYLMFPNRKPAREKRR